MSNGRILIIEDNPMNLELAADLLEAVGYPVARATTAEQGIQEAQADPPALILMDVSLAGMDGLTATRILRQAEPTKAIPIVALTAHAMTGDEEKALAAGCNGYITKPIDTRTFPEVIAGFMASRKTE